MGIEYVNRRGHRYYLHQGKSRTGKPTFFFSRKRDGTLADAIPAGFEVYEDANARVTLRKVRPKLVTDEEVAIIERGIRKLASVAGFHLEVEGNSVVVHTADNTSGVEEIFTRLGVPPVNLQQFLNYTAVLRFELVDEQARLFAVERWCFRGSIDRWIPLAAGDDLETQVARYCPHLGQESFFDLM